MSFENIKKLLNKNNFEFHYRDKVESTMSEIKKIKSKKNICLMADQQTKGVGRRSASWVSPKGNIYISILLKNIINTHNHFYNTAHTANIICDVIENICNVETKIKWPNDILIKNKKISGIISEIYNTNNDVFINTGLGINITSSPIVNEYETTFINEYSKKINNIDFLYELMDEYLKNINVLKKKSILIIDKYKSRLKYLSQNIKLKLDDNYLKEGLFYGLNNDGSIILQNNTKFENIYNARILR